MCELKVIRKKQNTSCINQLLNMRNHVLTNKEITAEDIEDIALILHEAADLLQINHNKTLAAS